MVYAISAFGNLFVTVFMRLGCSSAVTSLFASLPLNKWGMFAIMMGVVFILGFLMDWIAVCMITIPIFLPIATAIGFDACYFLTMMAIIMQTAFPVSYTHLSIINNILSQKGKKDKRYSKPGRKGKKIP